MARDDGRNSPRGVGALPAHEVLAAEVHRVLHGPTDPELAHAAQRFLGRVVQMRDRPAQRLDRHLAVHALEDLVRRQGAEAARRIPPVVTGHRLGVVIGGGTDAHRVASYNPFTSLQWFLDGKSVAGTPTRGPEETPDRLTALRFYTLGSAWFSFDDDVRGSLEVGKLADLAVLSGDYLTVPVEEVGNIESVLTLLGGDVVYAAGEFAPLEN